MDQIEKAARFAELHVKGTPVVLYNAWDAGSAIAVAAAGAKAIATSSWAVAETQGYRDGEAIPLEFVYQIVSRIVETTYLPVTVDFEGGYGEDDTELAENITRLIALGVVGINFEDRVVKGSGLYEIDQQARRIAAIRTAAEQMGVDLFINARTDVFLGHTRDVRTGVVEVEARAKAYAAAGASGVFVPGLVDTAAIGWLAGNVKLPLNVMVKEGIPSNDRLAKLGVSRISYGAMPFGRAMSTVEELAKEAFL